MRFATLSAAVVSFGLLATLGAPATAEAQCNDPASQVLTFPEHLANDVPPDVVLRAEFPATRDPRVPPTWNVIDNHGGHVAGVSDWDGDTSTFTPYGDLEPRRTYTAMVTANQLAESWQFSFGTGYVYDGAPPEFAGIGGVSWEERDEQWLMANCAMAVGDGFMFSLRAPLATDDASGDDLSYYVYQTRGPGISGTLLRLRTRRADDEPVRLLFPIDQGEGEFCFRVEVRDLAGRMDGNRRTTCVEVVRGAVFNDMCSVAAPRPRDSGAGAALIAGALLIGLALRRSRRL